MAGHEDEGLGRFRLFCLSVVRTCPPLGENWIVNWRNEAYWTDGVSVDLFKSVINLFLERPKEVATSSYFLSADVSPSDSVTLRKTIVIMTIHAFFV